MNKNFQDLNNFELIEIEGGSISGALALAWGITKAVGIVAGTATTVYVSGKAVKKVGDWIWSKIN
ncbi:hypothetical protein [Helcococcus ovis]|uniref:hypothetical protein n=1 Tax=Helcococcus ovis TaxID=72026 RepID=UPI0010704E57|nr:hypothetical protein [Helcococcus ovis]TFF65823.1 hypothetical protein EQF93_07970 [Helcococcus ovis]WNZ00746.1 hypothetical protein EQF90_005655 [Helcococcus ovis]